ncbi:hypothetical protein AB0D38_05560 [Streptomyces sp. NPDC048279]|uniref:hypothetical protein n=1 Tax=Streptomyces sp. NPDC048279 TaxID=3154714 RepID=UPI003436B123
MRIPLHLPTYLTRCLRAFGSPDVTERRTLLRATHWSHHAAQVRNLSASAAYTTVVQSTEVLMGTIDGFGAMQLKSSVVRTG